MSWKDRAISAEPKTSSWKDRAVSAETEEEPQAPLPELNRAEAATVTLGNTMGIAPLLSGVVGAGMELADDARDMFGEATGIPTTVDAQLRNKGFEVEDDYKGLSGLMKSYYDARDNQKAYKQAAHKQYPIQSIASEIVGSIPLTIASAGLGQAGTAGNVLSKILPQADKFTKATTLGTKIAAGAREGAKAGALVGFGEGDGKLLGEEGDLLDVATGGNPLDVVKEVAASTVGGAAVGGVLPVGVAAAKLPFKLAKGAVNLVDKQPIVQQMKTAFKGGNLGLDLSEEAADEATKNYSKEILGRIRSSFSELGITKADASDYADEIGVRIKAGEATDEVLEDMVKRGAVPDDIADKTKFYNFLNYLKEGPENTLQNKTDVARAKMIDKMEQKGYELLDENQTTSNVQDILPKSNANSEITTATQNFQKIGDEFGEEAGEAMDKVVESPPIKKILQQVQKTMGIDLKQYNLNKLTIRELDEIIGNVNTYSGIKNVSKGPVTPLEKMAAGYAAALRDLGEEAMENAGTKSGNTEISSMYNAIRKAGIKGNIQSGNRHKIRDYVDEIKKTIQAGDSTRLGRMGESLLEADPSRFGDFAENTKFFNNFGDLARQVKPLGSSNTGANQVIAQMGGVKGLAVTTANTLGKTGVGKTVSNISKGLTDLVDMPSDQLNKLAQSIQQSNSQVAREFAQPLLKAAQSEGQRKSAILYGLYQQPAFRETYEKLGGAVTGPVINTGEKIVNELTDEQEN